MSRISKTVLSIFLAALIAALSVVPVLAETSVSIDEATYDMDNELPVIPVKLVSSITVSTNPQKVFYQLNDELVLTNGKLTVYYDDESTKVVDLTTDMVSGFDSTKEGSQDLLVTYEGKTTTFRVVVGAGFTGRSLVLKDSLYMNIYIYVPEEEANDYSLRLTYCGESEVVETSEMVISDSELYTSFYLPIKEVGNEIKAELLNKSTGVVETKVYSVKDYCIQVLNMTNMDNNLKNLMKCLLDYSTYMQIHKSYNLDSLSNLDDGVEYSFGDDYYETISVPEGYENSINGELEGIEYTGRTLVLDSVTNVNAYFALSDGAKISDYSFKCDGKELTPYESNGEYYVSLPGYAAKEMNGVRELVVTKKTGDDSKITYRTCILAYAYDAQGVTKEGLDMVVKALYEYYRLSVIYFNNR